MRTIVQEYGPIYGEPVNGTVQGRPNGSIYVPLSNTIVLTIPEDYRYLRYWSDGICLRVCASDGEVTLEEPAWVTVAESQDQASYIEMQIFTDSALTSSVGSRDLAAGIFNAISRLPVYYPIEGLTDGQTLYGRAQLMNNGVPVATSETIEITMVVPE